MYNIKLSLPKRSWTTGSSPYSSIKVNPLWDKKSMKKVTDFFARQWGQINWQKQLFYSEQFLAVNYGCAGHGGIICFSTEKLPFFTPEISSEEYNHKFPKDWYVYIFEEDCDWAMFFLLSNEKVKEKFLYNATWTMEETEKIALDNVKRYNPEFHELWKAGQIKKLK